MIGLLVITHARLARELVNAAEFILGKIEQIETLSVENDPDADRLRKAITASLERLEQGQGVLILTDMFGGTPNNVALAFLNPGKIEVITGVNLPMIIKASTVRAKNDLSKLANLSAEAGKGAISVASEILSS